jgi:NADH-quinone oxidoreductase subunit N
VLSLCLAMVMLSLAGIPPLFGFWAKFVVFQAAVSAGFVPLAAIGIAASVIGAFYYLKIVKILYFDDPVNVVTGKSDWILQAILALSAVAISPLGYLATKWLGGLSHAAAQALFQVG